MTRGHDERRLGARLVYCYGCKAKKPPGGWQKPCPVADRHATPLVVPIPTMTADIHRGFHRGVNKPGG